ncbi:MAG: succinylglutamate desuccinylase/aspartoacylase family protein [Magnetococcales bacterium]|nr:succinylglutamate desuccinylase/aspartoacylase family protein [Magnetococcales bacterium]
MHKPFLNLFIKPGGPHFFVTRRRLLHVSWILLALFSSTASGQPPGSDRKDALDLVDAVHEIVKKTADDAVATPGVNKSAPQPAPSPPPTAPAPPPAQPRETIPPKGETRSDATTPPAGKALTMEQTCELIGNKLGSVSTADCLSHRLMLSGGVSVNGVPIMIKEYPPLPGRESRARILLLGGIHGDEYSSISIVFRWMEILNKYHSGMFHWRLAPLVNPDGLLQKNAQRMNAHNVDLNRNFPTSPTHEEWIEASQNYWINETHRDPRRYPGPAALSEPESRWVAEEIARFKPDAVVSIHAPYGLLDFDGPPNTPPERLGRLYLSLLGTYPGSLGRYCGDNIKIPIITIELEHAGIMPDKPEIAAIWMDLVKWLTTHVRRRIPPDPSSSAGKTRQTSR